jgi:class 3 adenylate cyclase
LLTSAALPRAGALAAATAGKGILTVTSDPVAIAAGEAVMAVRSQPRVEIFVSRAAALAAGVEFSTAFRMMIQER